MPGRRPATRSSAQLPQQAGSLHDQLLAIQQTAALRAQQELAATQPLPPSPAAGGSLASGAESATASDASSEEEEFTTPASQPAFFQRTASSTSSAVLDRELNRLAELLGLSQLGTGAAASPSSSAAPTPRQLHFGSAAPQQAAAASVLAAQLSLHLPGASSMDLPGLIAALAGGSGGRAAAYAGQPGQPFGDFQQQQRNEILKLRSKRLEQSIPFELLVQTVISHLASNSSTQQREAPAGPPRAL